MNKQSKIAILGFGDEGKALLKYLKKHKYPNITVCDKNVDIKHGMPAGVSVNLGKDYLNDLDKFEVVFRSPGVKFLEPQVQLAIKAGSYVTSVSDYFMDQCPCPVIGVTGTKGKGTTSTLIYLMLKKKYKHVWLGGNIGEPPITFLDKLKGDSIAVLELSSFQLQDIRKSPHYVVFLNTTTDHLDYHVDRDEYMQAKEQILTHQNKKSVAVFNKDYEYSKYYIPLTKGTVKLVSKQVAVKNGAFVKDGTIYYIRGGKTEKIADVKEVALIGSHNLENIMPALTIAKEFGVNTKGIREVVKTFKGLPNRLEFVKEVKGVKYYNDSYSTTPETSMAAVDSFDCPTLLIAGGHDKGLNYDDWAIKILTKESLRTVVLIGNTADKMESALIEAEKKLGGEAGSTHGPLGLVVTPTKILKRPDLEEAVLEAYAETTPGWVVVMSPAAASFDQFKNYKERGEKFRQLVNVLR
jgi:UDP-N-acetylmuramoylalanine--D-glutamate ligase